jgi:hypothetical protein
MQARGISWETSRLEVYTPIWVYVEPIMLKRMLCA